MISLYSRNAQSHFSIDSVDCSNPAIFVAKDASIGYVAIVFRPVPNWRSRRTLDGSMIIQRGAAESRIVETGEAVGGGDIFRRLNGSLAR
jgi:hypothetical protein